MSRGKRILMISRRDHNGSGYMMAEAVGLTTHHFVEYVVMLDSPFPSNVKRAPSVYHQYELPILGKRRSMSEKTAERLQILADQADIIHFKGDDVPVDDFMPEIRLPQNTPRIITVSGSKFRRGNSTVSRPVAEFEEYIARTTLRTALTPDLNYPKFQSRFTQHAFDTTSIPVTWSPSTPIVICHSPSFKNKKGTHLLEAAVDILIKEGQKVTLDLIQTKDLQECLRRKSCATIFIDQICETGAYGNSAIEAMARGIPTVTYLSETSLAQSDDKLTQDCPILNCGNTVESLANTLRAALESDLVALSKRTKEWVDSFHSYETVGPMWGAIYDELA